mgnify:CR=1 FL=1
MRTKTPRIAIIYDHLLTQYGGAEQVLTAVLAAFPQAELFSTIQDTQTTDWHTKTSVHLSYLQKLFPLVQRREILDVLTPLAIEQFDLSEFEIVISITSSAVKGVVTQPHQLHLCYLLSPTRYLYDISDSLLNQHSLLSLPGLRWITRQIFTYLRWWDQVAIWRPDYIVAISQQVATRCAATYNRTVDDILYPPVDLPVDSSTKIPANAAQKSSVPVTQSQQLSTEPYLLCLSRLVPYKRIDLAIQAALQTNTRLCIAGTGREFTALTKVAGTAAYIRRQDEDVFTAFKHAQLQAKKIIFLGTTSDSEKAILLMQCKAFIMPGIEDFGITALEATAYGKPTIIAAESGVAELLLDEKEAIYFSDQRLEHLVDAVKKLDYSRFNSETITTKARQFSREEFVRKFHNIVFAFYREHSTIKQ